MATKKKADAAVENTAEVTQETTEQVGNIVFSGVLILLCNERGELNRVQFLNKHTDIEGFQLYTGRCKVKDD